MTMKTLWSSWTLSPVIIRTESDLFPSPALWPSPGKQSKVAAQQERRCPVLLRQSSEPWLLAQLGIWSKEVYYTLESVLNVYVEPFYKDGLSVFIVSIYSIFSQIYIVILQCLVHENKCYDSSYLVYFLVSSMSYHNDYHYIQIFFEHSDFTKTIL